MENKLSNHRIKFILNSPFLIFLLIGILVNLDLLVMGKYAIAKDHDFWDSFWPIQTAMVERLKQGKFPLWLAGYLSGSPFSFWDINWVSIPVLLTWVSKGPLGYFLVMLSQFVIAAQGMYLFLKRFYPQRSYYEFILAGALYAISIIGLTYWRVPDLAVMPLCIYSFYEFVDFFSGKKISWANAVLSYAIVALNAYLLKGLPALIVILLWLILFYKREQTFKKLIIFFFFILFIVLINAPTLAVNLTYLGSGMRQSLVQPGLDKASLSLYLSRLRSLIQSPHEIISMTVGTMAVFIFFISLPNIKKWTNITRVLFLYFVIGNSLFYFLNYTQWFEEFRSHLPFASYHLNHLLIVNPFILFLIIAENISFFVEYIKNYPVRTWSVISTSTLVLMFWHVRHGFPTSVYEMVITGFAFLLLFVVYFFISKRNIVQPKPVLMFFCLLLVERFFHLYLLKFALVNPPSFEHFANSPSYSLIHQQEAHNYNYRMTFINWHPAIGLYNNFQVAGGCANDYSLSYANYWNQVLNENPSYFAYPYKAYLNDLTTLFESPIPNIHDNLNFNFDFLAFNNIKYILTRHKIKSPEGHGLKLFSQGISPLRAQGGLGRLKQSIERIAEAPVYFVYRLENYTPRFFVNNSAQIFSDEKSLITYIKSADRQSFPGKTLLVNDQIPNNLKKELIPFTGVKDRSFENVDPTSYDDDRIEFSLDVKTPSFLIINDNYSPNWRARVNGEEVAVLKADLTLKAIPLLKTGPAKIELYYSPKLVIWGYYLSAVTFFFLAVLVLSSTYSLLRRSRGRS